LHRAYVGREMRIYISGKITGLDRQEAFAKFEAAEYVVGLQGFEPVNPMKEVSESENKTWAEYMAEDIVLLDQCDGIYMLPCWRDSKGARIEHFIAETLGKAIFYAATL